MVQVPLFVCFVVLSTVPVLNMMFYVCVRYRCDSYHLCGGEQ